MLFIFNGHLVTNGIMAVYNKIASIFMACYQKPQEKLIKTIKNTQDNQLPRLKTKPRTSTT
jgi:hypothetical protein